MSVRYHESRDLDDIHGKMLEAFQQRGIQIAKIYSATDEDRSSIKRKPHPYMGQCAKEDFPEIRFEKSIMVGNTSSDMAFGKSLGMKTVFIDDKKVIFSLSNLEHADFLADSLLDFATKLDDGSIQI
ncbi:MAG: HAD hydrolase-like protein [Bacteroidetes bacterium]|nr:HAD hydrolase-like protein [Bacteroidota bacterium]